MERPNLFIVGAPKCGTTSMHEYLAQHPQLCMSSVKEPHFFGRDLQLRDSWRVLDEKKYLNLFAPTERTAWMGESSVWYLYSRTAAEEIKAYSPYARILIMLRNPVDAMYSLHGQYLYSGNEDLADFGEAFDAQEARRRGERIPKHSRNPRGLFYSDVVSFSGQVRRYFDTFGRQKVHVILFDDFARDTLGEYRRTLRFLGVEEDHTPDLKVVNWAKPIRVPAMISISVALPGLRRLYHRVVPPFWRGRFVDALAWATGAEPRKPKIDPELRRRLAPLFEREVEELGRLLGRDVAHWARG